MSARRVTERFRTAAYIRLSREDGDREESDSVLNQKKLLQNFISSKEDLELWDFYVDDGYTGTNFERPAFRRMAADIESGLIDCVAVKDLSRFGRDYIDTGRYLERIFPQMGVRFISVTDQIDSSQKSYDMLLPIKNIFNEQYARDISQKIQATMREKQRAGEFIGAFASYGYKKSPADKNKLVEDPYAAGVVRRIFSMFLQGMGKQAIARRLNEEGVLCPAEYKAVSGQNYKNGNRLRGPSGWTYSTVNSILQKEIYVGNMVQGTKHQQMRGPQKHVPREEWIVVEGTHEAIIDRETWEKTRRLLRKHTRQAEEQGTGSALAGFLKCGDCGRAMVRSGWKRKGGVRAYSYYCGSYKRKGGAFCSPHALPLEIVSRILRTDLQILLQTIEFPETLFREAENRRRGKGTSHESGKIRGELERVRRLGMAVYEDYREGLLNREEYENYREIYRKKEELYRRQMEELLSAGEDAEGEGGRKIRRAFAVLRDGLEGELTREMAEELIDHIIVYEDRRLRIVYRFSGEGRGVFPAVFPQGKSGVLRC